MDQRQLDQISKTEFSHVDSVTGQTLKWHQENEAAISSKEEGIAVLQRQIAFWIPKFRDDAIQQKGFSADMATKIAKQAFQSSLEELVKEKPNCFVARFGITPRDLNWEV